MLIFLIIKKRIKKLLIQHYLIFILGDKKQKPKIFNHYILLEEELLEK